MKFSNVAIASVAYELPPNIVTSLEIEERLSDVYERLRFPYGRLEMMTGIRERRYWDKSWRPSQGSAAAGEKALAASGISKSDIGCIVHGSVCRDFMEPSTASVVHDALGLPETAHMFDVSCACLGMMNGLITVANMIEIGQIRAGIVVGCEAAEGVLNATIERIKADDTITRKSFKNQFASLTLASGASAIVLADKSLLEKGFRLIGGELRSDSSANVFCQEDVASKQSEFGPLMVTDSEALMAAGVAVAGKAWHATLDTLNWTPATIDHLFTHQIGAGHRKTFYDTLGVDESRDFVNVDRLGNIGACGLPTAFAMGIEEREINPGEKIMLMGIGSGISVMMLGVEAF